MLKPSQVLIQLTGAQVAVLLKQTQTKKIKFGGMLMVSRCSMTLSTLGLSQALISGYRQKAYLELK